MGTTPAPVAPVTPAPTINPIIAAIDEDTLTYAPTVANAVVAAEALGPQATGLQKFAAAVTTVSQSLTVSQNPNVAGIAALVNLAVQFANLFGAFKHKTAPAKTS